MKKSLVLGIFSLASAITGSFGQGFIALDNYNSNLHPLVTYGSFSSGPAGTPVNTAGWTVGIYYAQGDVTGSIASDPTALADPSTLGGGLILGTGPGSTAAIYTSTFHVPGQFFVANTFLASAAPGATITAELIGYNGSSYGVSTLRGHSAAFTMTTAAGTSPVPSYVGDAMPSFSVGGVPEPSVFALSSLVATTFVMMRRRK